MVAERGDTTGARPGTPLAPSAVARMAGCFQPIKQVRFTPKKRWANAPAMALFASPPPSAFDLLVAGNCSQSSIERSRQFENLSFPKRRVRFRIAAEPQGFGGSLCRMLFDAEWCSLPSRSSLRASQRPRAPSRPNTPSRPSCPIPIALWKGGRLEWRPFWRGHPGACPQ
jgi:hypothetical protein